MKYLFFTLAVVCALLLAAPVTSISELIDQSASASDSVCLPEIREVEVEVIKEVEISVPYTIEIPTPPGEVLTHAQETWISALEWCESRAVPTAINPMDSDGAPAYYSWQFKPGTFEWLGQKYGILPAGLSTPEIMELIKVRDLQLAIVRRMITDPDIIIENQFPSCVSILGKPPTY